MANERSPNYPALSLPQAVALARKLWNSEKRTPVSNEAAATAMGFKSLSGPARVAIGSLRQYGLIDKADRGHVRMSERAVHILIGEGDERAKALKAAETAPDLFQELAKSHADASENAIRSFLVTKKNFVDDGARKAAKAFRETLNLAKSGASGYTADEGDKEPEAMREQESNFSFKAQESDGQAKTDLLSFAVPYAKGKIAVQIRVSGEELNARHLAAVRRYLQMTESNMIDWPEGDLPPQDDDDTDPHTGRN